MTDGVLAVSAATLEFQNPIVLAAGTAGYGIELEGVIDLDTLGGFVTKAVSAEPRHGAAAPRVAEFDGGMINAVGLANPGLAEVARTQVPWLAQHHRGTRRLANVVGFTEDEFAAVIRGLDEAVGRHPGALDGYELNVSCPNTRQGGAEFGADAAALRTVISLARKETKRPIFVKLAPTLPDIAGAAKLSVDCGADGITVINTMPGLVVDLERRRPVLGFGNGGVSGAAILPVGVLATWKVSRAVKVPITGLGGVASGTDALQYIMAGATLVGVGTAALRDPRAPARIVREMREWCAGNSVSSVGSLRGTLEWPKA
jgi:dihydroorotate dehydrogenase (NAD+) catalytic subunit